MHADRRLVSRLFVVSCTAAFVALAGLGVGCSDDNLVQTTATDYFGTYGDTSGASGTISLSSRSAVDALKQLGLCSDAIPVAGELRVGGLAPIPIAGFSCPINGSISFTSEDETYEFTGAMVGGQAAGTAFAPGGQGSFVLFVGGTSSNVATYCATAICTSPELCQTGGAFNVAVSGSAALLSGFYNGFVAFGAGTAAASTVDLHIQNLGVDVTIHGDVNGTTISGTWTDNLNQFAGTWDGGAAQCSAPAPLRR